MLKSIYVLSFVLAFYYVLPAIASPGGVVKLTHTDKASFLSIDELAKRQVSQHNECIVRRVVFDIGSSATKVGAADVDICTNQFLNSYYSFQAVPYSKVNSSHKKLLDKSIYEDGINAIKILKSTVLNNFATSKPIEVCAFATAAFREAQNGAEAADYISKHTVMPLRIISQHEEGVLAFNTARMREAMENPYHTVIWDIGGASTQLTAMHKDGSISVSGSQVAGQNYLDAVLKKIKKGAHSPYPMSRSELDQARILAREMLVFNNALPIHKKLGQQSRVLGVAPAHNSALRFTNNMLNSTGKEFTKEQISAILERLVDMSEEDILNFITHAGHAEFLHHQFTNLVLIEQVMEQFNIDEVATVDHHSVDGVLTVGCSFYNPEKQKSLSKNSPL